MWNVKKNMRPTLMLTKSRHFFLCVCSTLDVVVALSWLGFWEQKENMADSCNIASVHYTIKVFKWVCHPRPSCTSLVSKSLIFAGTIKLAHLMVIVRWKCMSIHFWTAVSYNTIWLIASSTVKWFFILQNFIFGALGLHWAVCLIAILIKQGTW